MLDITVVGEVTIDVLDQQEPRYGGITYSALAARWVGTQSAVVGYVGRDAAEDVKSFLQAHGVDHRNLRVKEGPTTAFYISGSDEVEEPSVCRQGCGFPHGVTWDRNLETKALLLYSCPPDLAHAVIDQVPNALVCFDLQYDMGPRKDLEAILRRCNVVFASRSQAMEYFDAQSVQELADHLLALGPSVVVIKCGLFGSLLFSKDAVIEVPRFYSDWRQSVGAGDVYNAVFIAERLKGADLRQAGYSAAAATARYCEGGTEVLLGSWDQEEDLGRDTFFLHPDSLRDQHIYLAAPFFNWSQRDLVNRTKALLEHHGFKVYSPFHEDGILQSLDAVKRRAVYVRERDAIATGKCVVALLDGSDPGTLWEVGFAVGRGVPVIGLWTADFYDLNLMPAMSTIVVNSFRQLLVELLEAIRQ